MRIDKVYYINADSQIGRRYGQQLTARMTGLSLNDLERFVPKGTQKIYPSNEAIVEDIIADGFPEFKWFLQPENAQHIWQRPKNISVSWSHVSVLRNIVNRGESAIVLEDDTFLSCNYPQLYADLSAVDRPIEVAWLETWRWEPHESEFYQQIELDKEIIRTNISGIYSNYYGLSSRARYLSYEGAQRFLDLALAAPWYSHELIGWYYSLEGGDKSKWLVCNPNRVVMIDDERVFTVEGDV